MNIMTRPSHYKVQIVKLGKLQVTGHLINVGLQLRTPVKIFQVCHVHIDHRACM